MKITPVQRKFLERMNNGMECFRSSRVSGYFCSSSCSMHKPTYVFMLKLTDNGLIDWKVIQSDALFKREEAFLTEKGKQAISVKAKP